MFKKILLSFILFTLSIAVFADELEGKGVPYNAYLNGGISDTAIILCHGRGQDPTWDVVDPLRKGIHEKLGYHTVSLQMPTGYSDWRDYAESFPEAYASIAATVKILQAKGIKNIYLMGHSMGSRMTTAYLANTENHGIKGYIGVGVRNYGGDPLDSASNLEFVNLPVIDIWGDGKDAKHAAGREDLVSDTYVMAYIPDADHRFTNHEDELVNVVVAWLKKQK